LTPFASLEIHDQLLNIDIPRRQAALGVRPLDLTCKEFTLLTVLAQNAGVVVPRSDLLRLVWGYGPGIRTRTLDVHIRRLRVKLGPCGDQCIETIFGIGYRLQPLRQPNCFQPSTLPAPMGMAA